MINELLITLTISISLIAMILSFGYGVEQVGGRYTVFGDNANNVASLLAFAFVIIVDIILNNTLKLSSYRFLGLIILPFILNGIGLTASRGAFITLVIALLALFLLRKQKFSNFFLILLFGSVVLFFSMELLLSYDILGERILNLYETRDIGEREIIWSEVIDIGMINPIFGIGESGYEKEIIHRFYVYKAAHNAFLYTFAIGGIIALIIFGSFLLILLKKSITAFTRDAKSIYLLLFILTTLFMIRSGAFFGYKTLWLLFAMIGSYNIKSKSNYKKID